MGNIDTINVGGIDYGIADATARANALTGISITAYNETGNTASQAYSIIGTPINWKGTLYYTKTAVASGATWASGTNLTPATNLGKLVRNIKTYVGSDSKIHFTDLTGADTALNFSSTPSFSTPYQMSGGGSATVSNKAGKFFVCFSYGDASQVLKQNGATVTIHTGTSNGILCCIWYGTIATNSDAFTYASNGGWCILWV